MGGTWGERPWIMGILNVTPDSFSGDGLAGDRTALLELLRRLPELRVPCPRQPLLVGPSRKQFIGHVLGLDVGDRLEGTLACVALAVAAGADIVRVHEVLAALRVARMAQAIAGGSL